MSNLKQNRLTDLDEIERRRYVSALFITLRKGKQDVEVRSDAHEVIALLKLAGYVVVTQEDK